MRSVCISEQHLLRLGTGPALRSLALCQEQVLPSVGSDAVTRGGAAPDLGQGSSTIGRAEAAVATSEHDTHERACLL